MSYIKKDNFNPISNQTLLSVKMILSLFLSWSILWYPSLDMCYVHVLCDCNTGHKLIPFMYYIFEALMSL